MTEAIGPGTILVCTKYYDPPLPPGKEFLECFKPLTPGAIYTCHAVSDIHMGMRRVPCVWDNCGYVSISVEGRRCDCYHMYFGYCPNFFRPLNDGDTSLIDEEFERKVERVDFLSTHLPDLEKINV